MLSAQVAFLLFPSVLLITILHHWLLFRILLFRILYYHTYELLSCQDEKKNILSVLLQAPSARGYKSITSVGKSAFCFSIMNDSFVFLIYEHH